ncbi:MAG TPA: PrsW family glutamic-type intramembrane protease [Lacipirellulaceae bacterium]|nr:PrsW family glutamic-type intramembrane protease [Lacipirellulaceae bacterium]
MSRRRDEDSIEDEPHFRPPALRPPAPPRPFEDPPPASGSRPLEVEHSVWDELALAPELAGAPCDEQVTYARWLEARIAETSYGWSLAVTAAVVLLAGPLGIAGALWEGIAGGGRGAWGLATVVVFGPVAEEIAKVALALWIVEKRPYWFKSIWQIMVAAAAGGLMFGVIENLIYLHIYIPDASPALARFRWTVCTALHLNCSSVAGVGLARVWDHTMRTRTPPQLGRAMPWLAIAMLAHGLYNLGATIATAAGWLTFDEVPVPPGE